MSDEGWGCAGVDGCPECDEEIRLTEAAERAITLEAAVLRVKRAVAECERGRFYHWAQLSAERDRALAALFAMVGD